MKREEKRSSSLRRNKSFESKGPPPPPPPPPPTPNQTAPRRIKNKLYICGLLPTVMREELIKIFAEYGKLQEVWVAKKPPGFAFVEYINPRDAEKVVHELDGTKMLGSKVRIEFAKAAKAPDEIRKPKKFPSGMFPTPAKKPLLSSAPIKIPLLGPPAFPPAMRPSSPPLNLPRRMEGEMGMRRVRRNSGGEMSMRRGSPPPYFEPRGSRSPIQRRRIMVSSRRQDFPSSPPSPHHPYPSASPPFHSRNSFSRRTGERSGSDSIRRRSQRRTTNEREEEKKGVYRSPIRWPKSRERYPISPLRGSGLKLSISPERKKEEEDEIRREEERMLKMVEKRERGGSEESEISLRRRGIKSEVKPVSREKREEESPVQRSRSGSVNEGVKRFGRGGYMGMRRSRSGGRSISSERRTSKRDSLSPERGRVRLLGRTPPTPSNRSPSNRRGREEEEEIKRRSQPFEDNIQRRRKRIESEEMEEMQNSSFNRIRRSRSESSFSSPRNLPPHLRKSPFYTSPSHRNHGNSSHHLNPPPSIKTGRKGFVSPSSSSRSSSKISEEDEREKQMRLHEAALSRELSEKKKILKKLSQRSSRSSSSSSSSSPSPHHPRNQKNGISTKKRIRTRSGSESRSRSIEGKSSKSKSKSRGRRTPLAYQQRRSSLSPEGRGLRRSSSSRRRRDERSRTSKGMRSGYSPAEPYPIRHRRSPRQLPPHYAEFSRGYPRSPPRGPPPRILPPEPFGRPIEGFQERRYFSERGEMRENFSRRSRDYYNYQRPDFYKRPSPYLAPPPFPAYRRRDLFLLPPDNLPPFYPPRSFEPYRGKIRNPPIFYNKTNQKRPKEKQ